MGDGRNMIAGLYDLEETIGEGHYAVVKLARHVFTGEKVAVKVQIRHHYSVSRHATALNYSVSGY